MVTRCLSGLWGSLSRQTLPFDITTDPDEQENRIGEKTESDMIELLRVALTELEAPSDQFERIGLR